MQDFKRRVPGLRIRFTMNNVIRKFVEAHDRYLALDSVPREWWRLGTSLR